MKLITNNRELAANKQTESERQQRVKKKTVNLFIDSDIIKEIREEANQKAISLNSRINGILAKHIQFYKPAEEVHQTCIVPKKYFQFMVDYLDEESNIAELTEILRIWIPVSFNDRNIPFTLDNFIKYVCEENALNSRTIDSFNSYTDECGDRILVYNHQFGIKWSKVLSQSLCTVITELLKCRTVAMVYPGSFVVKVINPDSRFHDLRV